MASSTHVTLPKTFDTGKASEWFQRFEICCRANGWDNDKMALKLPTLLEGEALAVWLELSPGATTTLKTAVERAKIIMTVEQHTPAAAAQSQPSNEFHQLQQQISELTAQVAALSMQQSRPRTTSFVAPRSKRCFLCNKIGHLQYNYPTHQDPRFCFTCGQQGHGWRTCPQENGQGATAWGSGRPRQ